eukprot:GHRR01002623.1.p1 GENE.GHRR01002623.1~~GHRR01002623.1.p1  ORF type:complete len:262 (+),score=75.38 GHRR01002623.1:262-1047(+)
MPHVASCLLPFGAVCTRVALPSRLQQQNVHTSKPDRVCLTQLNSSSNGNPTELQSVHATANSGTQAAASQPAALQHEAVAVVGQQPKQTVLPFAALTRVLLTAQNSGMLRTALSQRRQPVSGPMSLILFLLTLFAASIAAIRGALVKKGKSCKSCRGFGLQRCRLCLGAGRVDWAAKLQHFDICPLCMNKRFIICTECGGHYHRPMFEHLKRQAGGAVEQPAAPVFEGPIKIPADAIAQAALGVGVGTGPLSSQIMSTLND